MTAPEAAWAALYAAHKDNRKHYFFFQHNAFKGKDKLMALYEGKMATGQFAEPAGYSTLHDESQTQRDDDGDGEEQLDDDNLSVTSQLRRAAGIAFPDNNSDSGIEGTSQANREPSILETSVPAPATRNKRKRPAEESPPKEQVKKERSSADKIRAGLDRLSARAEASNDIRREALAARIRLVDHTIKSSSAPHELAFEILQKEYRDLVDKLPEEEFEALLIMLEQPMRLGNTLSTTTSKGRHFCMLPAGARRDAFAGRLLSGIKDFLTETVSSVTTGLGMLEVYGGPIS